MLYCKSLIFIEICIFYLNPKSKEANIRCTYLHLSGNILAIGQSLNIMDTKYKGFIVAPYTCISCPNNIPSPKICVCLYYSECVTTSVHQKVFYILFY